MISPLALFRFKESEKDIITPEELHDYIKPLMFIFHSTYTLKGSFAEGMFNMTEDEVNGKIKTLRIHPDEFNNTKDVDFLYKFCYLACNAYDNILKLLKDGITKNYPNLSEEKREFTKKCYKYAYDIFKDLNCREFYYKKYQIAKKMINCDWTTILEDEFKYNEYIKSVEHLHYNKLLDEIVDIGNKNIVVLINKPEDEVEPGSNPVETKRIKEQRYKKRRRELEPGASC